MRIRSLIAPAMIMSALAWNVGCGNESEADVGQVEAAPPLQPQSGGQCSCDCCYGPSGVCDGTDCWETSPGGCDEVWTMGDWFACDMIGADECAGTCRDGTTSKFHGYAVPH